ncbi:hypothetical protein BOTBODRAFT_187496 [Botryobasidium botryosum FD-172 SS1]|uniref:Uncharacterized protein n=1 Tax=Botryobasidium botryosum (strain FD-172 SS1) TaxID=930990 RepID=A0A067MH20_BOTB1|nr:hypothetical protein BOTBODRAFT_187496 [Botryobasidium botryosum FD-172 SS1]
MRISNPTYSYAIVRYSNPPDADDVERPSPGKVHFATFRVRDVDWSKHPFDSIEILDSRKALLKSLAQEHIKTFFEDFVEEKGQGLVFNLYGSPGVGKTLIAEGTTVLNWETRRVASTTATPHATRWGDRVKRKALALNGAISRIGKDDTAFAHRDPIFTFQLYASSQSSTALPG